MNCAPNLRLHVILAAGALLAIVFIVPQKTDEVPASLVKDYPQIVDIAFEHSDPLSVKLSMSKINGQGIIEIENKGEEEVLVSIPSTWQRGEVRNVSIEDVTNEPPGLGFTRWHFPPNSGVTFLMPTVSDGFLIHNPTGVPLKVRMVMIDLATEEVWEEVVLVREKAKRVVKQ